MLKRYVPLAKLLVAMPVADSLLRYLAAQLYMLVTQPSSPLFSGMRRFLLFSRRTEIRKMSLDVPYWADVVVPLKKLRNVVALDVDSVDGWYGSLVISCMVRGEL